MVRWLVEQEGTGGVYSERLRELFRHARHAGRLEDATHYGESGFPGQGPYVQLWLKVEEGQVVAARFKTYGCPAVIACAEALCRMVEGRPLAAVAGLTAEQVAGWVEGVPEGKEHCPELVVQAWGSRRPV